jgi:hypothetical protein
VDPLVERRRSRTRCAGPDLSPLVFPSSLDAVRPFFGRGPESLDLFRRLRFLASVTDIWSF